jgi:hypothetical protein
MLNLMLFLLFNQSIDKDQFMLIEKDPISFSKLIYEIKKTAKKEQCLT